MSLAARALFKWCDVSGTGSAQTFVVESNWTRAFQEQPCGFEYAVLFCNGFWVAEGWNSIAGTNFNRLRTVPGLGGGKAGSFQTVAGGLNRKTVIIDDERTEGF